ncbi:MAG: VCBS repeat-containing protein, partial [Crocinitomicaceae bacterium]
MRFHLFFAFIFTVTLTNAQFFFKRSDFIPVYKNAIQQEMAWVGGLNFVQFSNIDLDYDGNMDLFIFDRSSNKWMTFLHSTNPGTEEWTYAPEYESAFPNMDSWVLLRDYNCDGKMDIYAHTSAGIKLYKNIGNATSGLQFELIDNLIFTLFYGTPVNLYVSAGDIPGIIDIDGDGDLDVLTFGVAGSTVEYHKNYSMELYGVC